MNISFNWNQPDALFQTISKDGSRTVSDYCTDIFSLSNISAEVKCLLYFIHNC